MIIAMEEYIEKNNIVELKQFSKAIRYEQPEWHTILCTKMTMYFSCFIRSCRHQHEQPVKIIEIDKATGEVLE